MKNRKANHFAVVGFLFCEAGRIEGLVGDGISHAASFKGAGPDVVTLYPHRHSIAIDINGDIDDSHIHPCLISISYSTEPPASSNSDAEVLHISKKVAEASEGFPGISRSKRPVSLPGKQSRQGAAMEPVAISAIFALAALFVFFRLRRKSQLAYIQSYEFHPAIKEKVGRKYPQLNDNQIDTIFDALKDYFTFCNRAKRRMVAMPSQAVDAAWHEFILFTRAYQLFSRKAIGRFLHHTPTVAMRSPTIAQESIRRTWRLACAHEGIDPATPSRLPLIFAIDTLYGIEDGFVYSLNCRDKSSPNYGSGYCAGHIACAAGCAGDSGGVDGGGFFDGFGVGSDCSGSDCGGSSCGGGD